MSSSMQTSIRSGRRSVSELAADVGVSADTLRNRLRRMEVQTSYAPGESRREKYVPHAAEPLIRQAYADRAAPQDLEGWPDATTAARLLGLTKKAFLDRLRDGRLTVERRRTSARGRHGVLYRYSPSDLRRAAAGIPVRPRSVPRGALGVEALAALLGVSGNAVRHWSDNGGCPDGRTLRGHRYVHVARALAWLEGRSDAVMPLRTRHLERLTLWLEGNA